GPPNPPGPPSLSGKGGAGGWLRRPSSPLPASGGGGRGGRLDPAGESVAGVWVAGLVAGREPVLALLGGAVRPLLGPHAALELLLEAVVADGGRGVERVGDVRVGRRREVASFCCVARPDAGVAVGLQLDAHAAALRPGPMVLRLRQCPGDVLNVVAILVGQDVGLGERPAVRAELRAQVVVEAEVNVDVLIRVAVEGADVGGGLAAGGLHGVGEEDGLGRLVALAALGEVVLPVLLDAVHVADDATVLVGVGVGARAALLRQRRAAAPAVHLPIRRRAGRATADEVAGIDAEEERNDQHDQADAATADHQAAATEAAAAPVFHLRGVEIGIGVELHVRPSISDVSWNHRLPSGGPNAACVPVTAAGQRPGRRGGRRAARPSG